MTNEGVEFYCSDCGHKWNVPYKDWSRLVKVMTKESPGRITVPKCPKCGYEDTAVVGKPNTS